MFIAHRLLAIPVVDDQRRLLGAVDIDTYAEELSGLDKREGNDELFQLIGVQLADARHTSPVKAFQSRFPWLLANIAGGILAAFLSGVFKAELEQVVTLALFIPIVLALAESVSSVSIPRLPLFPDLCRSRNRFDGSSRLAAECPDPKTVKDFPGVGTKTSQKQLRHINGRPEYRGGGYFDNAADAQAVLDAFHSGDATIIGTTSQGFPVVRYGGVTGTNVNVSAGFPKQPTNVFIIKGTASPSVVPANPNWGG